MLRSLPAWCRSQPVGHLLAVLAGACLPLAFSPFEYWPLALLVPLAFWQLLEGLSNRQALLRGWLFGLGVFGAGTSWVFVSIHTHSDTSTPVALLLTFLFVASLALLFALHAWLWQRWIRKLPLLLGWPALWVLMEWLRSWLFTGFPWLLLGTAHLESPLGSWAPLLGVFGVSAISLLLGLLVCQCLTRCLCNLRQPFLYLLAALLLATWQLQAINWTRPEGQPLQLALVQSNIEQANKWDPAFRNAIIRQHLNLTASVGSQTDLVIWPETAVPLLTDQAEWLLNLAVDSSGHEASALISGMTSRAETRGRYYNSLVTAGNASGIYHKQQLVPFGEYLPLESWLRGLVSFFDLPMSSFVAGTSTEPLLALHTRVAPLICYEVAYPDLSARLARTTHWLLTVSNDAWFGDSIAPWQHLQIARFRALETQRPMARVANTGVTALIDHQGTLIAQLPQFQAAVLEGALQPRAGDTLFMRTGSWPILLMAVLALLLGSLLSGQQQRSKPETQPQQQ